MNAAVKLVTTMLCVVLLLIMFSSRVVAQVSSNFQSGIWKGANIEYKKGEALLVTDNQEIWTDLLTLRTTLSVTTPDSTAGGGYFMIEFPVTADVLNICSQFESATGVKACIPSLRLQKASEDTYFQYQWNMYNDGSLHSETAGHDIMLDEAHAITRGSDEIKLVIIDSGVPWDNSTDQPTHLDLNNDNFPNHVTRATEYPEGIIDPTDEDGHGTQVAGIALGEADNDYGIAGMCPECRGVIYKAWDITGEDNTLATVTMGIWRAANLEGTSDNYDDPTIILVPSTIYADGIGNDLEILRAFIDMFKELVYRSHHNGWPNYSTRNLFTFPTGNDNLHYVPYPASLASYDRIESGVISVGATNIFDNRWVVTEGVGSNYWGHAVTLTAPGGGNYFNEECEPGVLSTDITSNRVQSCYWGLLSTPHSDLNSVRGTSIASAHVAGLAGLVWSLSPTLTNYQVKTLIEAGVDAIADEPGEFREVGAGRINAFKTLLRVPGVEKRLQRDVTIRKSPYQFDSPYQLVDGDLVVPAFVTLTIEAGVTINFSNCGLRVEPGGRLIILGEDGNEVTLRGYYKDPSFEGSRDWTGIIADDASLQIQYCNIQSATTGITLVGSSSSLNLSHSNIANSTLNGLRVLAGARAVLSDCDVHNSEGNGIDARNATLVSLEGCRVEHNNLAGYAYGGGVFALFVNQLTIRCTEITLNTGAGLYSWWSNVRLAPTIGGNPSIGGPGFSDLSRNSFIDGQCYFRSSVVHMQNGHNRFGAPQNAPDWNYLSFRDRAAGSGPVVLNGNHWSITTPGQEEFILSRISATPQDIVEDGFAYETDWELCDEGDVPTYSDCDIAWDDALYKLANDDVFSASDELKELISSTSACQFKALSPRAIVTSDRSAGSNYDEIIDLVSTMLDTTTDVSLKFALAQASAEALGFEGNVEDAISQLDSLSVDSLTSIDDSVSCQTSVACLNFLWLLRNTSDADSISRAIASLDTSLNGLFACVVDTNIWAPVVECYTPESVARSDSALVVSANVYTLDSVGIATVFIDIRHALGSVWMHDTLVQQTNDTVWEFSVVSDSLGGGVEFRLWAEDSLNRIMTWPIHGSLPNLNDTLTHFVSFEPRLTAPLTDTAYVYAPGVITQDITIGDGGVLYILPAPVELDSYVVSIDSAVGITLSTDGGVMPKLVIAGTDSTVIRLDCASDGDRWSGIQSYGGWVEANKAELRSVASPLSTEKQYNYPVVRFSDVEVSGFGSPLVLTYMNPSDADSSFLVDCTISDGDSAGMVILMGSLDVEDVTIEDCDRSGVVLFEPADQLFSNVRITNNGGYGVTTDPEYSGSLRLSNCYVAFNGDTLPEIKVYSNSTIDVSDDAGNVVKDSTGVLFECAEVNDFDAELGSNSFVLADTTGKYFNVASMSGPAYITGNSFYPESVNDSTFIDDFLKQDTLSKWVYSYLRAEDQMDDVIEDPNGSIDFELKAYVQNYLGTVTNDTITQVGFKYRLFPDSSNWTTYRQNTIETDSIYDWTVSVGDQGGLISYIWWVKDAHGRYMTSPAGADTTSPDSGATRFLSFEIADTSIVADSVTIWAPTTLTHNINVGCLGRLVVKPWPGASDHTVTMAEGVAITVIGSCGQGDNRAKAWILGTESMPITFEAAVDTLEWQHIYLNDAILTASYTTFRTNLVAFEPGFLGNPEIKLDHCTFESSDGFFATMGTDVSTSYLRNCVFRDLGMTWDDGSFVVYGGDIEISDCWFYNNGGNGIVLYEPLETVISGTNSIANDLTGLLSWGVTSSASITCSEFSYNGGDSTSEVLILDGVVDFSNDAGNVFADKAGILLEGSAMENFELVDGGNGFYLFDSTGQYVYTGDETDTLDVGGNLWYPWTPDTSIFQDYFEPDTSRFWDWDQPAVALASCGVGQGFSMPGGGAIALVRPDQQTYGTSSHGGGKMPLGQLTKSGSLSAKSSLASKSMASESKYQDALADQKGGRYATAKEKFGQFVNQNLNDARTEAALSRLMVSARKTGQVSGLVEFFAGVETRSESPRVKRAAKFLKLDAMTLEGRHQEALNVYDEIITHPESRHDSLTAAIEATHLLFAQKDTKLATSHPENQSSSALEMYRRILRLIAQHQRSKNAAIDGVDDAAIPASYALYQNYPNPFNPNTEIRFDLPEAIHAELKVFNILGQEVVTLVDDVRAAGAYRVLWDGKNAAGLIVASGVYIYQIKTPNFQDAKKMMLIR